MRTFELTRGAAESWPDFVGAICARFAIDLVHLHNISGCRDGIITALAALRVPYGYTVHDLNFACPTILFLGVDGSYCGQVTDPGRLPGVPARAACVRASRHRRLAIAASARSLANAAFLIAPSRFAASALERYYPEHRVEVIPHATPGEWALQTDDARGSAAADGAEARRRRCPTTA